MVYVHAQVVPRFTVEPVPQRVVAGHSFVLETAVDPPTARVSWYRDGEFLVEDQSGSLELQNVTAGDEGFYQAYAVLAGGACWSREIFVRVDTPIPAAGNLDPGFFTPQMSKGSVDAIVPLGDGRVAIGGRFDIAGVIQNLAILGSDGRPDTNTVLTGFPNGKVRALTLSGNRLIIGGDFSQVGNVQCRRIAAIDLATGGLAANWNHLLGLASDGVLENPSVLSLTTDSAGRILAGGRFTAWHTTAGPVERSGVIRLGLDGDPDMSFNFLTVGSGDVRNVASLADGRMAVVGAEDGPPNGFAVLDETGAPSAGFSLDQIPDNQVRAVLQLPDGSFLIGGDFGNIGKQLAHYFSDGTLDTQLGVTVNRDVNTIVRSPDGKIVLGGLFVSANGRPKGRVMRLNADLSVDESLVVEGLDAEVDSLAIVDGKILAGGDFDYPHASIVRLSGEAVVPEGEMEIVRSPESRELSEGDPLDLRVSVFPLRAGLLYRWTRDGEVIEESDSSTLVIDRVERSDSGRYQVEVFESDSSIMSAPARVSVGPRLPGVESERRYRGGHVHVLANRTSESVINVADAFSVRHVRVSVNLLHESTTQLNIFLVSPDGTNVRLFNLNTRQGAGLRHTSFDDEIGDGRQFKNWQPPFTGVFQPDEPLAQMTGVGSAGTWRLRFESASTQSGDLLDWQLELRSAAMPVDFASYRDALGFDDDDDSSARQKYASAWIPQARDHYGMRTERVGAGKLTCDHWAWNSPDDLYYSYEANAHGSGWSPVVPSLFVTSFPDGREHRRVVFSVQGREEFLCRMRASTGN